VIYGSNPCFCSGLNSNNPCWIWPLYNPDILVGCQRFAAPRKFFFKIFFKESLIAFILYRIWRWTAAPGVPQVASLFPTGQSLPSPLSTIYMINSATASHHFSSSHNISPVLPLPSPTHGHPIRCAAFCAVHPSRHRLLGC